MIYLDNAASSHPKPPEVIKAVTRQLRENGANPGRSGHGMALAASETVFRARKTLADAFGTEPETVLFTQNTTDAINRAMKGLIRPGDQVLISDLEHNSVLRPLTAMEAYGVQYRIFETGQSDEELLERFKESLASHPNLVFCTNASNVTGRILPVLEMGKLCKERGILFAVDGAQTAGTEDYCLQTDPIDLLCVPGHKGLLGPQGTGALLLARPLPMTPLFYGGTGSDSLSERQPTTYPEGYESGTLNTPGIAGLDEGVRFAVRHREAIRVHEQNLRALFLEEMGRLPGYRILSPGDRFVATVSFVPRRTHSEALSQYLDSCGICVRGGYHCSLLAHKTLGTERCGAVRISFGYRNTERDVYECIKCLKKYQNY